MTGPKSKSAPSPGEGDAQISESNNEAKKSCEPCQQIRFAFGRNGNHFFYVRDHMKRQYTALLPKDTASHLGAFSTHGCGGEIYTVAISADGAILLAGRENDDEPVLRYAGAMGPDSAFQLAYKRLWDAASARDVDHLNITFGPHGSYYCVTKGEPIWRDIPATLQTTIAQESSPTKRPRQVALGVHDTWICLWSDYSHSFDLGSHYQLLATKLDGNNNTDDSRIAFVALNPWQADSWLLADCGGLITWENAPAGADNRAKVEDVRILARDYMQRRARRTGATFTTSFSYDGREPQVTQITPQTRHDDALSYDSMSSRLQLLRDRIPPPLLRADHALAGGAVVASTAMVCRLAGARVGTALNVGMMTGCVFAGGYLNGYFKK
ncbi:hypothetical protein PG990_006841 [Apiospora arundinis]